MEETSFELAKSLGRVAAEDEEPLRRLCALARAELAGRLREGITEEDCGGAFPMGCAYLALAALCAAGASGTAESFSAGGLTVRRGSGRNTQERSEALRAEGERAMAPFLRDGAFAFLGVRG